MTAKENLNPDNEIGGATNSVPQPEEIFMQNLRRFLEYTIQKGAKYDETEDRLIFQGEVLVESVQIYLREETEANNRALYDWEIAGEFMFLVFRKNLERFRGYALLQGAYYNADGHLVYKQKILTRADDEYLDQSETTRQRLLTDEEIEAAFLNLVFYAGVDEA